METEQAAPKRKYAKRNSLSDAHKAINKLEKVHKFAKLDIMNALKSKECAPGTNSRLAYLKALQQLEIDYVEQLTKWGVLPKNVAAQTTTSYVFKVHAGKGGGVTSSLVRTPAEMQELERMEAREIKKGYADSAEDNAIRNEF